MKRKLLRETVTTLRGANYDDLRRQCRRWVEDHEYELDAARPDPVPGLDDRQKDVTAPLLAVADAAGGEWPARLRAALSTLLGSSRPAAPVGLGPMLLADLRDIFTADAHLDRFTSADLMKRLNALAERPWPTFRKGREMTPGHLSRLLKPYGIVSRDLRMPDDERGKGYQLADLQDAFDRYLLPPWPGNPVSSRVTATSVDTVRESSLFASATEGACRGCENTVLLNNDGPCRGDAAKKPESPQPHVPGGPAPASCARCGTTLHWRDGRPWRCSHCHPPERLEPAGQVWSDGQRRPPPDKSDKSPGENHSPIDETPSPMGEFENGPDLSDLSGKPPPPPSSEAELDLDGGTVDGGDTVI